MQVGPSDVRHREDQCCHVVLVEKPGLDPAPRRSDDRTISVTSAFRGCGGPGRVVDPANFLASTESRRPRIELTRVALGQLAILPQPKLVDVRVRPDGAREEVPEVGAPPGRRGDVPLGRRRSQNVRELPLAVDRKQRDLYRIEPAQRGREDERLDPRRKLPGHDGAGVDAQALEPSGHPRRGLGQCCEGHRAAAVVHHPDAVRRELGPLLNEVPHRVPTRLELKHLAPSPHDIINRPSARTTSADAQRLLPRPGKRS